LPWPEWGETDFLLTRALAVHERLICKCGCGQWALVSHDEETAGRWQPHVAACQARAAMNEFLDEHSEQLPPGALVWVTLLGDGEEPFDPLEFDPERAAAERAAMERRLGISTD